MANLMLLSWPVVALILFASLGREKGLIWTVVVGYLLLPENIGFDLPGLPDYTKSSAISVAAILGGIFFGRKRSWPDPVGVPSGGRDRFGLAIMLLLVVLVVGAFMTMADNGSALINAERVRRGLQMRDLISMVSDSLIAITPFLVAWLWLRQPHHHQEVLRVLVLTALVYSILALYEMRMSPQLNRSLYGYFPHAWQQHVRGGQFRPVIFLQHGLWLAFFLLSASFAGFGLFRTKTGRAKWFYLGAALWLLAVLFISPNLGAAMLAFIFVPMLLMLSGKVQARIVMIIAVFFLVFPSARQANLVPLDSFLGFVEGISAERAQSLSFRLENEDDMLAHAARKPVFGWGGWGRWRVINEKGIDTTVSDGLWIIFLGSRGWVGYLAYFGILTLPLLVMRRTMRKRDASQATVTLGIITAANLVYLVPNSALSPIGWLLSGAVAGFISYRDPIVVEKGAREAKYIRFGDRVKDAAPARVTSRRQTSKFSRF